MPTHTDTHTHTHAQTQTHKLITVLPSSYQGKHHEVSQCARVSVSQDKTTT